MLVADVHNLPTGIGDLFLWYRPTDKWCWLEVKSKGGKQTPLEIEAQERWGEHYLLAFDIDTVLRFFGLMA